MWSRDGFTIRDKEHQSLSLSKLCMSEMYSDFILISQDGTRFPAHRSLLAARSDYFSKLLYGGLKETKEEEVKIMCTDAILKLILSFLYTGEVCVMTSESVDLDDLVSLLNETRAMCIDNLQAALEDLIIEEFINNAADADATKAEVINILNAAVEKDFPEIRKAAKTFLEKGIDDILNSSLLLNELSPLGLKELISGNDLDIPEIDIFRGVSAWIENNLNCEESEPINSTEKSAMLSEVRLDQMTPKQLTKVVRPSGLFLDAEILDAIQKQQEGSSPNSRKIIENKNICLTSMGAIVLKGEKAQFSTDINVAINGSTKAFTYNYNIGYTMCKFGERLEIELPSKQAINQIKVHLYDRDQREYSYRIETSMDQVNWDVIKSFPRARSWHTIDFPKRRAKYIGIVGLSEITSYYSYDRDSTPPNYIHVISVEAMLDRNIEDNV